MQSASSIEILGSTTGKTEVEWKENEGQKGRAKLGLEQAMSESTRRACATAGISLAGLTPIQRMFLTHYRCSNCKMLPLYHLDLKNSKRPRCGVCRSHVALRNSGKYGKVRKQIAFML